MHGVSLTKSAVLLGLHPFGMVLLLLRQIIVAVMAFSTFQCDPYSHFSTSYKLFREQASACCFCLVQANFGHMAAKYSLKNIAQAPFLVKHLFYAVLCGFLTRLFSLFHAIFCILSV